MNPHEPEPPTNPDIYGSAIRALGSSVDPFDSLSIHMPYWSFELLHHCRFLKKS